MKRMIRTSLITAAVGSSLLLAGCERPPVDTVQKGYRGTGMLEVYNPRTVAEQIPLNQVPEASSPLPAEGPKAGDTYQNVQVLGDLSVAQFTRLMLAITEWVSPEQGCNYCHEGNNLASDALYTKRVSRRMIEMTQHINVDWQDHVVETGVTCYTCHRGQPVPNQVWFTDPGPRRAAGMLGDRGGQNFPEPTVAYASLPYDPLTPFLGQETPIRILGDTALPTGNRASIKQTEWTYGLMMYMSESLGVNCTYCHNTRSFAEWEQSSPQRVSAWHGIEMVQDLNADYLIPLTDEFPPHRLGPLGDVAKVGCATCHQGAYKPLYGANMTKDYPSLTKKGGASQMEQMPTQETQEGAPLKQLVTPGQTAALEQAVRAHLERQQ